VSLRTWFDKLTGRRPPVEEPAPPDPFEPPLPVRTPEEQEVEDEKKRRLLDEYDKKADS
jgi:hypothetical protein